MRLVSLVGIPTQVRTSIAVKVLRHLDRPTVPKIHYNLSVHRNCLVLDHVIKISQGLDYYYGRLFGHLRVVALKKEREPLFNRISGLLIDKHEIEIVPQFRSASYRVQFHRQYVGNGGNVSGIYSRSRTE